MNQVFVITVLFFFLGACVEPDLLPKIEERLTHVPVSSENSSIDQSVSSGETSNDVTEIDESEGLPSPEVTPSEEVVFEELPEPEVPVIGSRFLSSDDVIVADLGDANPDDNITLVGALDFPQILYGPPQDPQWDVLSLGHDGEITIQLNGFLILDGPGVDFTIFENPIRDQGFGEYLECAQVSVSQDGITYKNFDCKKYDGGAEYSGCAGKTPVNSEYYGDAEKMADPSVSGGDQFDLADLSLDYAKYIKIKDIGFCLTRAPLPNLTVSGPVYRGDPLFEMIDSDPSGFDFDALVIVNGLNE